MMIPANVLRDAMQAAITTATSQAANNVEAPANSREYVCSIEGCDRKAYAAGLCNGHYIRQRNGKSMTEPLRARKRDGKCAECGEATGAKGGWGMCKNHYRRKRYEVLKDALIAALGGKCGDCQGVFHRAVYDFHHVGKKTDSPGAMLTSRSVDAIAEEISVCKLLCANCHRMEHNEY